MVLSHSISLNYTGEHYRDSLFHPLHIKSPIVSTVFLVQLEYKIEIEIPKQERSEDLSSMVNIQSNFCFPLQSSVVGV